MCIHSVSLVSIILTPFAYININTALKLVTEGLARFLAADLPHMTRVCEEARLEARQSVARDVPDLVKLDICVVERARSKAMHTLLSLQISALVTERERPHPICTL